MFSGMLFIQQQYMEMSNEIENLRRKLKELKKECNRLFADQVELYINMLIITDKQNELLAKNQELLAMRDAIRERKLKE
jgi:hypothetical protein